MAYDEQFAQRIRDRLLGVAGLREKKMFGGLAFLVRGHLAVAASAQGGLLVRVDPTVAEKLLATTGAVPMDMRGRPMAGWLRVQIEELPTDGELDVWLARGVNYVRSLPPK